MTNINPVFHVCMYEAVKKKKKSNRGFVVVNKAPLLPKPVCLNVVISLHPIVCFPLPPYVCKGEGIPSGNDGLNPSLWVEAAIHQYRRAMEKTPKSNSKSRFLMYINNQAFQLVSGKTYLQPFSMSSMCLLEPHRGISGLSTLQHNYFSPICH